jgi:hypothetical protein
LGHGQHRAEMKLAKDLAYYSSEYITGTKSFIMFGHGQHRAELKLANDLAYYSSEYITAAKGFCNIGPSVASDRDEITVTSK